MFTKQINSNRALVTLGVTVLVFSSMILTAAFGHGDKKHDDGEKSAKDTITTTDTAPANDSLTQPSLQPLQTSIDSVYIKIALSYQTVEPMLKNSCYDCHTTQTVFPWYHSLPLIGGWMDGHLEEAREHLDLDKGFPFGGHATQLEQLAEIKEVVEEGEMPIFSYRIMHWGKLIEGEKQDTLFGWIAASENAIKQVYSNHGLDAPDSDDDDDDDREDDDDD